ncbi:MAG: peptidoglycan-binding protein [Reyranellales bacterium]
MTTDPSTKTDSEPDKVPTGSSRGGETFKQSVADPSRRLGERTAGQPAPDRLAEFETRRAALQAYDEAHARRLRGVLGAAGAAVAAVCAAGFVLFFGAHLVPPSPDATASREPAPPIVMAAAPPAPAPLPPTPSSPSPANVAPAPPIVMASAPPAPAQPTPAPPKAPSSPPPANVAPAAAGKPAPAVEAAPNGLAPEQVTLQRDEVREVQAKLRSFGFDPGPIDGSPGRMTKGAALKYQQNRAHLQTGEVDRQLLEQLRQDPAPQVVAQRAARPTARRARPSDPFESLRVAGDNITQWLNSLTR